VSQQGLAVCSGFIYLFIPFVLAKACCTYGMLHTHTGQEVPPCGSCVVGLAKDTLLQKEALLIVWGK
jgi:hypothetical protein